MIARWPDLRRSGLNSERGTEAQAKVDDGTAAPDMPPAYLYGLGFIWWRFLQNATNALPGECSSGIPLSTHQSRHSCSR
jgi:hypothetical protein